MLKKFIKNSIKRNEFYLFIIIITIYVFVTLFNRSFGSLENILDLLRASTVTGVLAIGVFVALLSGGIDLSFTAIATFAMYLMGLYIVDIGGNLFMAFLIVSITGIFLGAINALLIHFLKIKTIIITIGTLNLFYGFLQFFIVKGRDLYNMPEWFRRFSSFNLIQFRSEAGSIYGISIYVLIWILLALVTWLILKYTLIGRGIYCLGSPEGSRSVKRSGFNIFKIQLFIYCYVGFLSGIASIIHVGIVDQVAAHSLMGRELLVIAAVVLGGTSLSGGRGTIVGIILGVVLITMIGNALVFLRISSYWYGTFSGIVILISLSITAYRYKRNRKQKLIVTI